VHRSSFWRRAIACRRSIHIGISQPRVACCPRDQIRSINSVGRPPTSIAFCGARSRAISQSRRRPSSSWWSTSRPPRPLASPFREGCSPSPTRSLNKTVFAAVHESGHGPTRKLMRRQRISGYRGTADPFGARGDLRLECRVNYEIGHGHLSQTC
jgi:hypothetical protein